MMDDLYSGKLLEAAASLPARRDMGGVAARARKTSRVCGSEVEVGLTVTDGVIGDVVLDTKACALGQAAASLFAKTAGGATPEEVRALRDGVRAMLKDGAEPPTGDRWAEIATLQPIAAYPARHASTLLVFEAAVAALDKIDAIS